MVRLEWHLDEAFRQGKLIRPSPREASLVHLVRAMATIAGAQGLDDWAPTRELADRIGPADHLVFILLDGLGMNLVERLPPGAFIRRRLQRPIQAACPSTTSSALTSVATAQWPSRHGITGWFTHLPEHDLTCVLLPFIERFTFQPLQARGLTVERVIPEPTLFGRLTHEPLTLMPSKITHTIYATWSRGGTPALPYTSIAQAVDLAAEHVRSARRPTYTHLYVPDIDSLCHGVGVDDPAVMDLVTRIDAEMARLAAAVAGRARIVLTADHGLTNILPGSRNFIFEGDPLLRLLKAPPSGDARLPLFHVREERRGDFEAMFQNRFGHCFHLLSIEEAERMEIFGPAPMDPRARGHFGDYVGIAHAPAMLDYYPPGKNPAYAHIAQHAGLSPEEMLVPLVVM